MDRSDSSGSEHIEQSSQSGSSALPGAAPCAVGSGWQPIETAPKDRLIDIWIPHADGGGVRWTGCGYDRICDEWRVLTPGEKVRWVKARAASHWMPEPAPPRQVSIVREQ